jgi:trk system potassium uptake protein TrkH
MSIIAVTTLVTAASGTSLFSSFNASISMISNIGFGAAGPFHNYGAFPGHIKLLYSFVMITGRPEIWTALILFDPAYWRR